MNTIYLVTRCTFDDRVVLDTFTDRDLAHAVAARLREDGDHYMRDEIEVEECDVDVGADQIRAGLGTYYVRLVRETGEVEECEASVERYHGPPRDGVEDTEICREHGQSKIPALSCVVWATDKAHAIKIASERRAAHLALGVKP